MKKKIFAALLTLVMIVSLLSTVALAARNPFTDVSTADWYYDEVMYANDEGLMTGTSESKFEPGVPTSRAMIWTILARMDGMKTGNGGLWYERARAWAIENGISDGSNPNGLVTREQFAAMLYRFCNYDLEDEEIGDIVAILARDCDHTNCEYTNNGDGTHTAVCLDCGKVVAIRSEHESALGHEWECSCGEPLNVWDGTAATEEELLAVKGTWVYYVNEETGDETLGNLFTISTPNLLAAYANYVNEGKSDYKDKVVLTADMNLGGREWTPIGTKEYPFMGRVFDGQDHMISNLRCNGGAATPTDVTACNQGLFGFTFTKGTIVEIMNLTIDNVDIYAKNSAGALIGCLDMDQSSYYLSGYTGIHDINLTGRVTIEGGNSGGITGAPVLHWALQTGYSRITIDADEGSYLSDIKAHELSGEGVGGALGGVAAVAAWDRGSEEITSNLDVIGVAGNVGGIVGVGNQVWTKLNCSGNVTVKGVKPSADGKYNYGLAIGGFAPVWYGGAHVDMSDENRATVVTTGKLRIELTDGSVVTTNGQKSDAIGGFFW